MTFLCPKSSAAMRKTRKQADSEHQTPPSHSRHHCGQETRSAGTPHTTCVRKSNSRYISNAPSSPNVFLQRLVIRKDFFGHRFGVHNHEFSIPSCFRKDFQIGTMGVAHLQARTPFTDALRIFADFVLCMYLKGYSMSITYSHTRLNSLYYRMIRKCVFYGCSASDER